MRTTRPPDHIGHNLVTNGINGHIGLGAAAIAVGLHTSAIVACGTESTADRRPAA
jgi:hypothetical protein